MNEQIERVGSHMANSIWQAISGMGKKELAKKARAVYYQMIADEAQLRAAYYALQKLGAAPDVLKPYETRLNLTEAK